MAAPHRPAADRYERMPYRRAGATGLLLPAISLGLWHNFGADRPPELSRSILLRAFDLGITHFDLANNYGVPAGSAETTFGAVLARDLAPHRDELVISSKAGHDMWPGPYGSWGSRKHLLASLDQSLRRLGLEYVDVFYSHRPDPATPVEETMGALHDAVGAGKALYAGISGYDTLQTRAAVGELRRLGTPVALHQPRYSMLDRSLEGELLEEIAGQGLGCIVYSPLAQGLLTDRYLDGVPADSRAARGASLSGEALTPELLAALRELGDIARARDQSLAQMALAWTLRDPRVTSAIIGASSLQQLEQNVAAVRGLGFDPEEIAAVERAIRPLGR